MTAPIVINPFGGAFGNLAAVGSLLFTVLAMVAVSTSGLLSLRAFSVPMRRVVAVALLAVTLAWMTGIVSHAQGKKDPVQSVIIVDECRYTWLLFFWAWC